MSLSSLLGRLFQSKSTNVKKIENLVESFCGSDSNFGTEIRNNFVAVWDSDKDQNIFDNINRPDYKTALSESLFMKCASNFSLGRHFIESIERDSLSRYLKYDIRGTISSSFYENIAVWIPFLKIYNSDYLLGCHFAAFFNGIKPYMELIKFNKLASTILDISFTQVKITYLYFEFLKHIDTYKQLIQHNKRLISSLDIFYAVTDAEYALVLTKSLPEKMLIAVSIILDCEAKVKSARKTAAKVNVIDQQFTRVQAISNHWSALKNYFQAKSLEDLNRIRSGILHENGIKDIDFTRSNHREQMKGALAIEEMLKRYSFMMHICFIVTLMMIVDETIIKGTDSQTTSS